MLTNSVTSQRKKVLSQITPKPCCRPGEESSGESLREKAEMIFLLVHSLYNSQTFKKKQRELVVFKVFICKIFNVYLVSLRLTTFHTVMK